MTVLTVLIRANGNIAGKVECKILDTLDPNHCSKTVECDEVEEYK